MFAITSSCLNMTTCMLLWIFVNLSRGSWLIMGDASVFMHRLAYTVFSASVNRSLREHRTQQIMSTYSFIQHSNMASTHRDDLHLLETHVPSVLDRYLAQLYQTSRK